MGFAEAVVLGDIWGLPGAIACAARTTAYRARRTNHLSGKEDMADPVVPDVTSFDGEAARGMLPTVRPIYAEACAEPPYNEGLEDVAAFADAWPWCVERPGFRLLVAEVDGEAVGFSFGFRLTADTGWWDGFLDPVDPATTREWDGRTFAIIELAVRTRHRLRGIARCLQTALLEGCPEERATLCARPESEAVTAMYARGDTRPSDASGQRPTSPST